jgi:hypothetical protein
MVISPIRPTTLRIMAELMARSMLVALRRD